MTKLRALLVDDEVELRKSVSAVLQSTLPQYNIQIAEAGSGVEALKALDGQQFDLVLMDVKMPEMDGLTALEQIKARDPKTFVVIMTAHAKRLVKPSWHARFGRRHAASEPSACLKAVAWRHARSFRGSLSRPL